MTSSDDPEKFTAYATFFIRGYHEALDANFNETVNEILAQGLGRKHLPLYGRAPGRDTGLAALTTEDDFYLLFLDDPNGAPIRWTQAGESEGYGRDWTFSTPYDRRTRKVREHFGLGDSQVLELVNIPGTNFLANKIEYIGDQALSHGKGFGNKHGQQAEAQLPAIHASSQRQKAHAELGVRYQALMAWTGTPQTRGQEFEHLWRDALALHSWHPKKIRIHGEDNDFTAIYQGLHILGEVRWFANPMTGGKMREFLGKLDPRPQTIGLFVSHSGFDAGAMSVLRRAVNSKTVVVFERNEIEEVLLRRADPGLLFDEKLRDVYDFLFEKGSEQ